MQNLSQAWRMFYTQINLTGKQEGQSGRPSSISGRPLLKHYLTEQRMESFFCKPDFRLCRSYSLIDRAILPSNAWKQSRQYANEWMWLHPQWNFIYKNGPKSQLAKPVYRKSFYHICFSRENETFLESTAETGWAVAYLGPDGFLEAAAELGLGSHRIDVRNDLLVGVRGVDGLGLLDGQPLVRDLGLAWLGFFYLLASGAFDSWNLMDLDWGLRGVLHVDIDYVGRKFYWNRLGIKTY